MDSALKTLNCSTTIEVMDIINSVNAEGSTVIIVTHDAKVAARTSSVIYLMVGNIHEELAPRKYEMDENNRSYCEIRLFEFLEKQGFLKSNIKFFNIIEGWK